MTTLNDEALACAYKAVPDDAHARTVIRYALRAYLSDLPPELMTGLNDEALVRAYNAQFVPDDHRARVMIKEAAQAYMSSIIDQQSYADIQASGGLPDASSPVSDHEVASK